MEGGQLKTQLPKFEGQQVKAAALKVSGRCDSRVGALGLDEEVYLVIKVVVAKISHGDQSGIFTRTHDAKAVVIVPLERASGARILDEASALADERFGIANLFNELPPDDRPEP
jgi:hypothetical protein